MRLKLNAIDFAIVFGVMGGTVALSFAVPSSAKLICQLGGFVAIGLVWVHASRRNASLTAAAQEPGGRLSAAALVFLSLGIFAALVGVVFGVVVVAAGVTPAIPVALLLTLLGLALVWRALKSRSASVPNDHPKEIPDAVLQALRERPGEEIPDVALNVFRRE